MSAWPATRFECIRLLSKYRWAYEEDSIAQMNAVLAELGGEEGKVTKKFLDLALTSPNTAVFVVLDQREDRRRIVGMAVANILYMPDDIEGRIDNVAVLASHQRLGIARLLMSHVIDFCYEEAAVDVELTCKPERVAARTLYESLGFTERETNVLKKHLGD